MVMRRRRAWADTKFAGTTLASSGTIKSDLLANLAAVDTKTLTRLIVDLWAYPPVTNAAAQRANAVNLGIGVSSLEAFTAETLPDPGTQADYPQQGWLYVATKPVLKFFVTTEHSQVVGAHFQADLRAQRKVDRGTLFMVIENVGVNGADNVDFWGRIRALCLT